MTGHDVSGSDMPNFPWPTRPDASAIEDTVLAELLAGRELPADVAAGLQPVADVLAALRAGPAADELAGAAVARAEFRQRVGVSNQSCRSRPRRTPLLTSLLSAKAAAAAAVTVVSLGGAAAAAAYSGALPGSVQQFAHSTIGAPSAHPTADPSSHPTGSATPTGPNAAGPAAYGLCTAWKHAMADGSSSAEHSVAFRNLVKAAGGAGKVAAYCAAVPHPGSSASQSSHQTGAPSSPASGQATSQPSHPAQPSHPTPHATGRPTSHS